MRRLSKEWPHEDTLAQSGCLAGNAGYLQGVRQLPSSVDYNFLPAHTAAGAVARERATTQLGLVPADDDSPKKTVTEIRLREITQDAPRHHRSANSATAQFDEAHARAAQPDLARVLFGLFVLCVPGRLGVPVVPSGARNYSGHSGR